MSAEPLRRSDVNATLTPAGRRWEVENPEIAMLRHEPWSYSWRQVADALGISRQAAQQRFRKAGGHRRPGGQPGSLR
jgi:hypothetical protein